MSERTRPSGGEREIRVHHVAAEGFDRGADAYERARPSYPDEAVALVVERLGIRPGRRVLDLAAGTGKFTRLLVPTGAELIAVEPVEGIRAHLEREVPGVEAIDGTAESVPLPDGSIDAVVCTQAWHWFDSPRALAEMARVLRVEGSAERRSADGGAAPSGLAVLFNIRDESVDWVREVTTITEFMDANRPHHRTTRQRFAAEVEASGAFGPVELHTFRYSHTMTPDLLVERMASQSNVAVMDDAKRAAVLDEVRELARSHPDLAGRDEFEMPYDTEVALCFPELTRLHVQSALTEWGERTRRDLPWRRTRDPWAVLVSELMLQQTQVSRVVPKYEAFLEACPTLRSCADAPLADIVRLWAGLGYNRRAVNLHRYAAMVVVQHDGRLPSDLGDLLALPGIGPYTARAVAAFAFEQDVGILDTNAARVLARLLGRALSRTDAQAQADALVPDGQGWAWNQAMLDLGATVCTSRAPRCNECPVSAGCAWRAGGRADPDPAIGSAGVSAKQSVFEGSDRQGRGRLVDALRGDGAVARDDLADRAGWRDDAPRAIRAAESLVRDGLAAWDGSRLVLPG